MVYFRSVTSGESSGDPGARYAIVVSREVDMGVSPFVDHLSPNAIKAFRFEQGTESKNTLVTCTTPALEPGVDDHFVRRLDSTRC